MPQPKPTLRRLLNAVRGAENVLIVPHNNPDPDAIASAAALVYLFKEKLDVQAQIVYKGVVGRAENRAVTRHLDHPLQPLRMGDLHAASHVVLVDTQPGFGNNPTSEVDNVVIVIDHHQSIGEKLDVRFVDVRPDVGAASTIMVEYLREAKLEIPSDLATALFYGIKTDTMGLQRGASSTDHNAFCFLLDLVDFEAVARIERAQVSTDYFRTIVEAFQSTRVYDYIITSHIPEMRYPDLTADIADLLLRTRGCRWVFCSGVYNDTLYFSIRTENKRGAGQIARDIVGEEGTAGGHGSMAGGQRPIKGAESDPLIAMLRQEFLQHFSIEPDDDGEPLL